MARPLTICVILALGVLGCTRKRPEAESSPFAHRPGAARDIATAPESAPTRKKVAQPAATSAPRAPNLAPKPPAPLACVARYYTGTPVFENGRWWLEIEAESLKLPYDDGLKKSFEERLADPDLQDMFHVAYPRGRIGKISDPEHDPGRFRVDALFRATYGKTADEVRARLVGVIVAGQRLQVHQRVAPIFEKLAKRIDELLKERPADAEFLKNLAGTFNWRTIAGTDRLSAHAFGVSLDLNTARADYWRWQGPNPIWKNRIPEAIVRVFEAQGFIWGGRWYHFDTMHFEYRPELLDPSCRERAEH